MIINKNLNKILCLVFALLAFTSTAKAKNDNCSEMTKVEKLLRYDDLFIGEVHGTNEIPTFFECLINKALELGSLEIVVSLEMAEYQKNPSSPFWEMGTNGTFSEDGRSSEAMYKLVKALVAMEADGLIKLHFQHGSMGSYSPQNIGKELSDLSIDHKVIALAGSMHSKKRPPAGYDNMITEGMLVGPSFTHVMIASVKGGDAWNCQGICEVNTVAPWPEEDGVNIDSLINGKSFEHDLIYFLSSERVTASKPMNIGND